jgi:MFS transporter, FHS family, glucose/mannose:H+ symporter
LTGFFFSIIFPTTTAAVSDLHQENAGTLLGLLFTFGGLGGMLGPWLMGLASNWFGLTWGFSLVVGYCLIMVGTLLALLSNTRTAAPIH